MRGQNFKITICNIIIIAMAIASIVTLWVGNFWAIDVTMSLNSNTMEEIIKDSSNEDSQAENINSAGEESQESAEGYDINAVLNKIDIKIPISFVLKGSTLINSVAGNGEKTVRTLINDEVDGLVDTLMGVVDDVLNAMVTLVVEVVVDEAKKKIEEQIESGMAESGVPEEEVMKKLEEEYDVSEEDIETLKAEAAEAAKSILDGNPEAVSDTLNDSETLTKLLAVAAKDELTQEGQPAPTQEEIDAKAAAMKTELIESYESTIDDLSVDGEINKDTVVIGIMNEVGLKDENGEPVNIQSTDDVKAYISNLTYEKLGDGTTDTIALVCKIFGIMIIIVMASWAYVVVKIIVKLFASKNKSVRLFMPRFFGWMPHVFFVGLPMLVFGNIDKITAATSGKENLAEVTDVLTGFSQAISINITSLTWISALCSALLLIIAIPYYRWRKQIKREMD